MCLFPSEVVGSLFRKKNKGRFHCRVHAHDKGNACKQISKHIHTHRSLLSTRTQPVPLSLGSLSPSLHVMQIPALRTRAKGAKIAAPLAMTYNLHLQSHFQPAATNSRVQCLSHSPVAGVTVPPCTHRPEQGSGAEVIFPTGYCRHWCDLARRCMYIIVSAVVSFLLPLSRPSNRDFKELCNCRAQLGLQGTACVLIPFQLPSPQ